MFLKPQILKRIIKSAYNQSSLVLANTRENMYISGGYWEMEIKKEFLPKTILAAVIELAGEIPSEGGRFIASKTENKNVPGRMHVDIEGINQNIEISDVIIKSKTKVFQRLLQDPETLQIVLVNDTYIDIIDSKNVETDRGEGIAQGPFYEITKGILFYNNVMKFRVMHREDTDNKQIIKHLESEYIGKEMF